MTPGTTTANKACGTGTGALVVATGAHTVSETAAGTTVLANYTSVISGDCAADGTITLAAGQNAVCTITNTRLPTLTVNKVCVPTTDTGTFNLVMTPGTTTANKACGTGTGAVVVATGAHTVSETGGRHQPGQLHNRHRRRLRRRRHDHPLGGPERSPAPSPTPACRPDRKQGLRPDDADTGTFNLVMTAARRRPTRPAAPARPGPWWSPPAPTRSVRRRAPAPTWPTTSAVISGACAADGTITLAAGQNAVCTITNTRIVATTLTVNKVCVPTTDTGKFNLQIDGGTTAADALCGPAPRALVVAPGAHTVSETAGTGTSLANYTTVIGGACAADGTITWRPARTPPARSPTPASPR